MAEPIVVAIFTGWLLLCLLVHVPGLGPRIRLRDGANLIPEWRFFSPNPARGDYRLLFRDQFGDGMMTGWTEVATIAPRMWWNVIWNPHKRAKKGVFDAVTELAAHVSVSDPTITVSIPYLTLLNYVSSLERSIRPVRTQLLLMFEPAVGPDLEPQMLLQSGFHAL